MKNLLHRILKALNINGRDWTVFLPALLLAFSIWMIHNLTLKYNDYLSVSVVAKCDIDGHSNISANRCEVIARCRATGYQVIKSSLKSSRAVEVAFRHSDLHHLEGDTFYITSSDLIEYASFMYGPDVNVDYFVTDSLFFRFPYENYKKVPVVPIFSLNFREQYMSDGEIDVVPDSILIYGEPYHLDNIDEVYTKPIRYNDISEDVSDVIAIEKIKGVRMSESEVHFSLDVNRFVEISTMISVKAVNVPSDKIMNMYPSVVKVTLKCNFPLLDDPLSGLSIEADYSRLNRSLGDKCQLSPVGLSRGVISCDIDPVAVSCVIEDR